MWNQVIGDRLVDVVTTHLEVRTGPPPAKATEYSTVLLEFLEAGFGGLGQTNKYLMEQFTILFSLINGFFWESRLVHYCVGHKCCRGGAAKTAEKIVAAVKYSILRERPTIPEKSRWSKGVASLDFWVVAMAMSKLILLIIETLVKLNPVGIGHTGMSAEEIKQVLEAIDPQSFMDSPETFRALRGKRLKDMLNCLSKDSTPVMLWLLYIFLSGLRYVSQFLDASQRSVRIKARKRGTASGAQFSTSRTIGMTRCSLSCNFSATCLPCRWISRTVPAYGKFWWSSHEAECLLQIGPCNY